MTFSNSSFWSKSGTGASAISIEFSSKEKCEKAGKDIQSQAGGSFVCVSINK